MLSDVIILKGVPFFLFFMSLSVLATPLFMSPIVYFCEMSGLEPERYRSERVR